MRKVNHGCGKLYSDVCSSTKSQCLLDVSVVKIEDSHPEHFVCNAYSAEWETLTEFQSKEAKESEITFNVGERMSKRTPFCQRPDY